MKDYTALLMKTQAFGKVRCKSTLWSFTEVLEPSGKILKNERGKSEYSKNYY